MSKNSFIKMGILICILCCLYGCSSLMKGDFQMAGGNYDAAVRHYEDYSRANPEDSRAETKLGIAFYKAGKSEKAVQVLEKVIAENPSDKDANYYLGLARIEIGERQKAAENLKASLSSDEPAVRKEMNRQIKLLKVYDGLKFAEEVMQKEEALQTKPPSRNSVAVFYFKDISPDSRFKYLQKALASMVITDLAKVKSLQILERLRIHYLLEEMELGSSGIMEEKTAPRAGRLLGAEKLVVGTLTPGSIVNKTGIASTSEKRVIATFSISTDETDIFGLQKDIVFNILEILKIPLSPVEKKSVGTPHTKNYSAAVYYGQALDAEDRGEWKNAKKYYRKALEEDPAFLLAFWGYEDCPASSSPSIQTLDSMSPGGISRMIEEAVSRAESRQARVNKVSQPANEGPSDDQGSISVGW